MTNKERYDQVFMEEFSVGKDALNEKFVYQCVAEWDMGMIAALEEAFDIQMETDDIINLGSYTKGMEILEKYHVTF
jgi:hypothetical protein